MVKVEKMDEKREYPAELQENERALFDVLEAQLGKEKALDFILASRGEPKKEVKRRVLKIKTKTDTHETMEIPEADLSLAGQGGAERSSLLDLVEAKIEDDRLRKVLMAELRQVMKHELTDKERLVIILRLGLNEERPHKLREIGEMLNLSRERVRQIQKGAVEKLRKRVEDLF